MANTNYGSVEEYLAALPERQRKVLEQVRKAIRKAVPEADEVISYQIAAYKLGGKAVLYFAGWKEHFSLYPVTAGMLDKFGGELAGLVKSKGTLRFPLSGRVPVGLIGRLAKFRAAEVSAPRPRSKKPRAG